MSTRSLASTKSQKKASGAALALRQPVCSGIVEECRFSLVLSAAAACCLVMYLSWAIRASTTLRRLRVVVGSVNGSSAVGFSTMPASIAASGSVSLCAVVLK